MILVLLIIIGFIAGICFVTPACKHIPECVNLTNYWKKVKHHNVIIMITGGLIGAIIFTLCFTLT